MGSLRGLATSAIGLAKHRDQKVIRFGAVPIGQLPDGHPRVVNDEAIVAESIDELAHVHADGGCEQGDPGTVDPFEDQLLGFSRAQDPRPLPEGWKRRRDYGLATFQ